jgi:RNA polymerase sigma-70 factor, ECF subfamily
MPVLLSGVRQTADATRPDGKDGRFSQKPMDTQLPPPERASELLLAARHDPDAFAELHQLAWPWLLKRLVAVTQCPETSADIASETMARAVLRCEHYDPRKGDGRTWLWTIASNLATDWQRHGTVQRRARTRINFDPPATTDVITELLDAIETREVRDAVLDAMATLTPWERDIVRLRVFGRHSHHHIGLLVGCSAATVQRRYSRTIAKLRQSSALAAYA